MYRGAEQIHRGKLESDRLGRFRISPLLSLWPWPSQLNFLKHQSLNFNMKWEYLPQRTGVKFKWEKVCEAVSPVSTASFPAVQPQHPAQRLAGCLHSVFVGTGCTCYHTSQHLLTLLGVWKWPLGSERVAPNLALLAHSLSRAAAGCHVLARTRCGPWFLTLRDRSIRSGQDLTTSFSNLSDHEITAFQMILRIKHTRGTRNWKNTSK